MLTTEWHSPLSGAILGPYGPVGEDIFKSSAFFISKPRNQLRYRELIAKLSFVFSEQMTFFKGIYYIFKILLIFNRTNQIKNIISWQSYVELRNNFVLLSQPVFCPNSQASPKIVSLPQPLTTAPTKKRNFRRKNFLISFSSASMKSFYFKLHEQLTRYAS